MKDIETGIYDKAEEIGALVDWLILLHSSLPEGHEPIMYIDLEGVDLCREGSLSILTLLIKPNPGKPLMGAYLLDVFSLGSQAFNTPGVKGKTLKDILEDETIPKVFFDPRNDSDALFAHFEVALQGVEDVQLMESATRTTTSSRKYVSGLAKCIEQNVLLGSELTSWKLAKDKGTRLFKPEYGGSYKVFEQRPIPKDIITYCVGDVQYLPKLWSKFRGKTDRCRDLVNEATKKRIETSQKPEYNPHGPNRALSPWSTEQNKKLDDLYYVPSARDFDEDFGWYEDRDDGWYEDQWLTMVRPVVGISSTVETMTYTIPTKLCDPVGVL